jgi:hypothetical protein
MSPLAWTVNSSKMIRHIIAGEVSPLSLKIGGGKTLTVGTALDPE